MEKKNKKLKFLFMIIAIIFVFIFQTIAYSSIFSTMTITGDAYARVKADVRVTDFIISEVSSDSISYYEEFGKDHLKTNVSLPSSSSYIIYKVEATNFGSRAAGIYNVTLNNSNLKYELIDYTLGAKIYDSSSEKYTLGAKQTFYIKISYNTYNSSNTSFDLTIDFDFQPFYYIDYINFTGSYQKEIMGKSNLIVNLSYDNPSKITVSVNESVSSNYTFSNNVLTMNNISGDIIIKKILPYAEELLDTAVPVLDENMIPVMYNISEQTWIVADIYEPWYSYQSSAWANVIIVDNNVNYAPGTPIDAYDTNIKQWYVWIPQFLLANESVEFIEGVSGYEPDPDTMTIAFGNTNGMEEYVHTAFYNLYGDFLPGFWVGKFSTSLNNYNYDILPGKLPYSCTVEECSSEAQTVYNSDLYDSRMIKNSQWAAIAYLSTSIYGKPSYSYNDKYKEVYLANFCSAQSPFTGLSLNEHQSVGSGNIHEFSRESTFGIFANSSTTGTVYGVFDMVNCVGTLVAGSLSGAESIFGTYYDYDVYYTIDGYWDEKSCLTPSQNNYGRGCIDHAMWDTAEWYGDYYFSSVPTEFSFHSNTPYLKRGTYTGSNINQAGMFSVYGVSESDYGSLRVVLDGYNMIIV